jgi:trehalose/maltose hydrolase-like predicted phosphorylase
MTTEGGAAALANIEAWTLTETEFDVRHNRHYEALFALGSGTLHQRAALEEGLRDDPQDIEYLRLPQGPDADTLPAFKGRHGTYLPGVAGPHPTCGDERINLPAVHGLLVYAAGERLDMEHSRLRDYRRSLDLRTGRLVRTFTWCLPTGTELDIRFERFISARRRHVMALRATLAHRSGPPAELRFLTPLDAEVRTNGFDHFDHVAITGEHEPITLAVHTNSDIEVAAAALCTADRNIAWAIDPEKRWVAISGATVLDAGEALQVSKFASITSSRHVNGPPVDAARRLAWDAATAGFDQLATESDAVWDQRWAGADIELDGPVEHQQAIRAALYHLLRATPPTETSGSIDARAATGEALCGRVFWDSDIFVLPALLYTQPAAARALARYRLATVAGARENAARRGYRGLRFAWESGSDGREQCRNWQRADHKLHVTADVAYGLWHTHLAFPDDVPLLAEIAGVLVESARFWSDRVWFNAERDAYELLQVMGPDEYTPLSRNNAYSNRMAAFALAMTSFALGKLGRLDEERAAAVTAQLELADGELARFDEIAHKMHLPYDPDRGLVLQSDEFFSYEPFDFERWWPDRTRPLGATVAQEHLYRSQVIQQADVIQLMALFPHEFDRKQLRRAYEAYAPLTAHDSSLSHAMHALVACEIDDREEALRMFSAAAGYNLTPPNATEGVHAGCAGGVWQAVVFGFAGIRSRMQSEVLQVTPRLPDAWQRLRIPLVWAGQRLHLDVTNSAVTIAHNGEQAIPVVVGTQRGELSPGKTQTFDVA